MWNTTNELLVRAERIQRCFVEVCLTVQALAGQAGWGPPVNIIDSGSALHITVALPGVAPEDVTVRLSSGMLILSGRRTSPPAPATGQMLHLEIPSGRFERQIRLPAGSSFTMDQVRLEQGLLAITLRKVP
jgi:HSP20 family molecular chaperone IbpA